MKRIISLAVLVLFFLSAKAQEPLSDFTDKSLKQMSFAFADEAKSNVMVRIAEDEVPEIQDFRWFIFKHYKTPVHYKRFNHGNSHKHRDTDFSDITCAIFELDSPEVRHQMFRGYRAYEVEGLLAHDDFVATRTFPPFSRWLNPEPKTKMPDTFVSQMEKKFKRKVDECWQIAKLKDRNCVFAIAEFEKDLKKEEAMVVFAWVEDDQIVATRVEKRKFDKSNAIDLGDKTYYMSVWNVDDEGYYGIPCVSTIAYNDRGEVEIYIVKHSPESDNCMILRQKKNQLEFILHQSLYIMGY